VHEGTRPCVPTRAWRRHDLLRIAPDVWATTLNRRCPSVKNLSLVARWADRRWPVIVRARGPKDDDHSIPVGLPLPPAVGKHRIALLIRPNGILYRTPPPPLYAINSVAKTGWRSTIDALVAVGVRCGIEPAAFGSLLWQHATGLAYLSEHSDLDVLWPIRHECDVIALVFEIAEVQRKARLRIDGEVVFPDGSAVNWRELWNVCCDPGHGRVLAKSMHGARLVDLASLPGIEQNP
jgi:phosphoribosyl-dephospho-CoA transferase